MESDEKKGVEFVGNRTECALLMLLREWGFGYKAIRDAHHSDTARIYGFTSERKMASMLLRTANGPRLFNKVSSSVSSLVSVMQFGKTRVRIAMQL